jgi:hypothetical protein
MNEKNDSNEVLGGLNGAEMAVARPGVEGRWKRGDGRIKCKI